MKNISFKRKAKENSINIKEIKKIKGFQLKKDLKVNELLENYNSIGFQASHIGKAVDILKQIKKDKAELYLACTSNMVSSGLREIIAQLAAKKLIAAIITTTGAIEEDFIKTMNDFYLGSFNVDDEVVKNNGINRLGNIFVPDKNYCDFEDFHMKFIEKLVKEKNIWSPSEYAMKLGLELKDENSVLYQCAKNKIPIFCPGFVDGAIGDHLYFHNQRGKNKIVIDTAADITKFYNMLLQPDKTAGIILGGGIAKHHLIGAAILRNGLDYAIYIQTGTEYDGSLSGAKPKEAVSWNKLKSESKSVCIEADATIVFPMLALSMVQD
ncbi:MAG: deoxyhypusine synthase [Nanoarchaeota archaeon]